MSRGRGHGDLYVAVKVEVPTRLSKDQKSLIEQLDETMPKKSFEPSDRQGADEHHSLFDKVRDIFG